MGSFSHTKWTDAPEVLTEQGRLKRPPCHYYERIEHCEVPSYDGGGKNGSLLF